MTKPTTEDDEGYEPKRNELGQWVKGKSGNYRGRPRKQPDPPKVLGQLLAEEMDKKVPVNDNGTPSILSMREVMAARLIRASMNAKPKEMLAIMERIEHLTGAAPQQEDEAEIFTEEDRRLLEIVQRDFFPEEAPPVSEGDATDDAGEADPESE